VQWVERIEVVDGHLCPLTLKADGSREPRRLSQLHRSLLRFSNRKPVVVEGLELLTLSKTSAEGYAGSLGLVDASPKGHEVFCFTGASRQVLIPAAVLLYALVPRMQALGDRLLLPGSIDYTLTTLVAHGALRVGFRLGSKELARDMAAGMENKLLWLTCFPSGRRLWDSVHQKAREGVLGLELPSALIDGKLYGYSKDGVFYATRFAIRTIVPTEAPLPFAAPYLPTRLDVSERHSSSATNIRTARDRLKQATKLVIPAGQNGWRLSDSEWDLTVDRCRAKGYRPRRDARSAIDLSLEKLASGRPWHALDRGGGNAVRQAYKRWKSSGAWDVVLSVVNERLTAASRPLVANRVNQLQTD